MFHLRVDSLSTSRNKLFFEDGVSSLKSNFFYLNNKKKGYNFKVRTNETISGTKSPAIFTCELIDRRHSFQKKKKIIVPLLHVYLTQYN